MFNETASKAGNKALKEIKPIEYIIYKNKQSF